MSSFRNDSLCALHFVTIKAITLYTELKMRNRILCISFFLLILRCKIEYYVAKEVSSVSLQI